MTQLWTITAIASGDILCPTFSTPSQGSHPKDNGWAWDAATQRAVRIDALVDPTLMTFDGAQWIERIEAVEARLLDAIKAEAERRKMLLMSTGGAKKTEYSDKAREVAAWDSLAGTAAAILIAFNAMPTAAKTTRFPYATASAAAFGDTPADAIARFKGGISRSASIPALAAVEEKACKAIRTATTIAAKRAAAANIAWS